jgi:hypothetical protein
MPSAPYTLLTLNALVAVLQTITSANDYWNDLTPDQVTFEPFNPDAQSGTLFPVIEVWEENDNITDSNASAFMDSATFVASGYVQTNTNTAVQDACNLRHDMTLALVRATSKHKDLFRDGNGVVFVSGYSVKGQREILTGDQAPPGCVEVRVRVSVTFKQSV